MRRAISCTPPDRQVLRVQAADLQPTADKLPVLCSHSKFYKREYKLVYHNRSLGCPPSLIIIILSEKSSSYQTTSDKESTLRTVIHFWRSAWRELKKSVKKKNKKKKQIDAKALRRTLSVRCSKPNLSSKPFFSCTSRPGFHAAR